MKLLKKSGTALLLGVLFTIGSIVYAAATIPPTCAVPGDCAELTPGIRNLSVKDFLRLSDADDSHYVGFESPATVLSNISWTLPAADGTAGQFLSTNGSGILSWATEAASTSTYYRVTQLSDVLGDQSAHANKTWLFESGNIDLSGNTINIPENVTLKFIQGSISDGTVNFNHTVIEADNNTVFDDITLGTGLIKNKELNATWFGVLGDDSTDNSARMNELTLYLAQQGGGILSLPNGIYHMRDVVVRINVEIKGSGWDTIIKAPSNPTQGILNIVNPHGKIKNLQINGDSVADVGIRIYGDSGQVSQVKDVLIVGTNTYSLEVDEANNLDIRNNTFVQKVMLDGADNVNFSSNTLEGFNADAALEVRTSSIHKTASSALIESNWFESNPVVGYERAIIADAFSVNILNNHFHLPNPDAIEAIQVGANSDYCTIRDNNFQFIPTSMQVNILPGALNTLVSNNRGIANVNNYTDAGTRSQVEFAGSISTNYVDYKPLNSDITRLQIDPSQEKIQFGDNPNNLVRKEGANLLLQSNARTNIYSLGNNISLQAQGTNGTIYMNSPMRFNSLATLPDPTSYLRGVAVYDFTNHKLNITDGTQWNTYEPIDDNSSSGYIDIGEVRIQWGTDSADGGTKSFPVAFADSNYSLTTTVANGGSPSDRVISVDSLTSTSFDLDSFNTSTNSISNVGEEVRWQAIGVRP